MTAIVARLLALCLILVPLAPGLAQAPQPGAGEGRGERRGERPASGESRRLPADSVTEHTLELPGRTLRFKATAGSIPLYDQQNNLLAEIGVAAYVLQGPERAERPVTFALNGGPGAASAYLHLGVVGPWRLPLDGATISPSAPVALKPNAETWLDFTDLVLIDPVGTGYSRATGSQEDVRNRFYTVEGDVESLSNVMLRWLRNNDRLASPKFLVGESYGGFRGPLIARKLQEDYGVGLSGLVLLSPVLDFGWFSQPRHAPWIHVARLPSLAAANLERKGPVTREALAGAEEYATGEYLADLLRGPKDKAAVERLGARTAELTGLDATVARRAAGRIELGAFQREFRRGEGLIVSAYDTGVSGYDPDPTAPSSRGEDPGLAAMTAPLTSAIVDHLANTLKWRVDVRYELLNGAVNGAWRWSRGRGQPEALSDLRQALALDANMRVLVVHGFTDLVTPYFASKLLLDQLPELGPPWRTELKVYPGGHMFYSRDGSRVAFRSDAERMITQAAEARRAGAGQ